VQSGGAAQPIAGQPINDRIPVNAQLVGRPDERPRLLGRAVHEVGLQAAETKLGGPLGEAPAGGQAAVAGAADLGVGNGGCRLGR
jgi:hypothetical protein